MAHGVTGNTSVFGAEESRFEPSGPTLKPTLITKVIGVFLCFTFGVFTDKKKLHVKFMEPLKV